MINSLMMSQNGHSGIMLLVCAMILVERVLIILSARVGLTSHWPRIILITFHRTSQSLLDSLCGVRLILRGVACVADIPGKAYDGIRRRCLPLIYAALEPGTEDDRMKGALWTLNSSSFGECGRIDIAPNTSNDVFLVKYAISGKSTVLTRRKMMSNS